MNHKTDSVVAYQQYRAFCLDYQALEDADLGLPGCLHCGKEPSTIMVTPDCFNCQCDAHARFEPCMHVVGFELWRE
ncbi:hypothetical protein SEA_SPILLED_27 [Streptomyces phage Spilled]|nr:hypothetical protein SEA_BIRCHLYN_25 [Streptomyces phage Birchlyn]QPL13667.1 hypothetical protein SEA_MINDFLAYER_26 [Streptomyces phage MindFlayer]URM86817.1 hypothetical protein SEA_SALTYSPITOON_28 [Streptomyces phage SaltySpitoon]URM87556.1 hypothetical protein SEA_QUARAN19_28 [Streptomyces phage Quaran19]UVK59930.1 hypothetical protein SEA_SPILLED_27 [Streptomyces phage Spilled]UVK61098.1 hypothetical protein SEA_JIMJAM_28 [Streptomyces phage JimJam]WPH58573.1 hypothetical protein SEA_S